MSKNMRKITNQQGFTIIELMISTAVLSVILLVSTVMIVNIGTLYYKGINQSRLQSATRTISDEVAQHIQLSSGAAAAPAVPAPVPRNLHKAYCIGDTRYNYILNKKMDPAADGTKDTSKHVLWRDKVTTGTCPVAADLNATVPTASGVELMPSNSRLIAFDIVQPSPYKINITMAYGDSDLLCDTGIANDCTDDSVEGYKGNVASNNAGATPSGTVLCKGISAGRQFCATAYLKTSVVQRLR